MKQNLLRSVDRKPFNDIDDDDDCDDRRRRLGTKKLQVLWCEVFFPLAYHDYHMLCTQNYHSIHHLVVSDFH
jgi:hypothetical protein